MSFLSFLISSFIFFAIPQYHEISVISFSICINLKRSYQFPGNCFFPSSFPVSYSLLFLNYHEISVTSFSICINLRRSYQFPGNIFFLYKYRDLYYLSIPSLHIFFNFLSTFLFVNIISFKVRTGFTGGLISIRFKIGLNPKGLFHP